MCAFRFGVFGTVNAWLICAFIVEDTTFPQKLREKLSHNAQHKFLGVHRTSPKYIELPLSSLRGSYNFSGVRKTSPDFFEEFTELPQSS